MGGDKFNNGFSINNPALGDLNANSGISFLQKLVPALVELAIIVGAVVFFFMLVLGGIQWIASGGDKASLEGAKGKLTNALIGIVVLFSVFAIIKFIESFFNISILTLDITSLIAK